MIDATNRASRHPANDPITLEIIQNSLQTAADEMFAAMKKTAMSSIIYEVLDMGTGIMDAEGEIACSGAGIPAFIGVLDKAVKVIAAKYDQTGEVEHMRAVHAGSGIVAHPTGPPRQRLAYERCHFAAGVGTSGPRHPNSRSHDCGDDSSLVSDLDAEVVEVVFEFSVGVSRLIGVIQAADAPSVDASAVDFTLIPGPWRHRSPCPRRATFCFWGVA